jgi:hypothetical protein
MNRHCWRKTVVTGGRPPSLEDFRRLETMLRLPGRRRNFPGRQSIVAGEKPSPLAADRRLATMDGRFKTMDRRRWRQTAD